MRRRTSCLTDWQRFIQALCACLWRAVQRPRFARRPPPSLAFRVTISRENQPDVLDVGLADALLDVALHHSSSPHRRPRPPRRRRKNRASSTVSGQQRSNPWKRFGTVDLLLEHFLNVERAPENVDVVEACVARLPPTAAGALPVVRRNALVMQRELRDVLQAWHASVFQHNHKLDNLGTVVRDLRRYQADRYNDLGRREAKNVDSDEDDVDADMPMDDEEE